MTLEKLARPVRKYRVTIEYDFDGRERSVALTVSGTSPAEACKVALRLLPRKAWQGFRDAIITEAPCTNERADQ